MFSHLRRAIELVRTGGLRSLVAGVRRFLWYRYLRAIRFVSLVAGNRLQPWSEGVTLKEPIFVVGSPRSGTSIFVRSLSAHPAIAEWSEAGEVWDPDYYDPEGEHEFTAEDLTEADRQRIRNTFVTYAKLRRKPRFLNKHPRNSLRIDYIRAIFPGAHFVHVVRHPVGPVDSMRRRSQEGDRQDHPLGRFVRPPGWEADARGDPVETFAASWEKVNRHLLECHDERVHVVRYEDFCEAPVETLNEACGFTELEPVITETDLPGSVENHNATAVKNLSSDEFDTLWEIVAPTAESFGYVKRPESTRD